MFVAVTVVIETTVTNIPSVKVEFFSSNMLKQRKCLVFVLCSYFKGVCEEEIACS
jgi:hypothetical protein